MNAEEIKVGKRPETVTEQLKEVGKRPETVEERAVRKEKERKEREECYLKRGKRPETEEERTIRKEKERIEREERYKRRGRRPETEKECAIRKGKALSFKVILYLNDYCDAYEIQRFFVPQDLHYLKEKIKSLFGKKVQHGFKIFWMDNDGDEVRIKVNFS